MKPTISSSSVVVYFFLTKSLSKAGVPSLGTVDILDGKSLCWAMGVGGCPVYRIGC